MALSSMISAVRQVCRLARAPQEAALTDRELLRRFVQQQDEAAFAVLVHRHGPMILGVCRRALGDIHAAEDAFQATFLVLLRKAGAVPWRETVGGWLYQVAHRTARKARSSAALRRRHEQEAGQSRLSTSSTGQEPMGPELHSVLEDELQRLPAHWRQPLVLCCVCGLTKGEAARELGCPEGTVSSRLARGREVLRRRLGRRGVAVSLACLDLAFTAEAMNAAVPAALKLATLHAAAAMTGQFAAVGGLPASVAVLVQQVLCDLGMVKLKIMLAALMLTGLIGTSAGLLLQPAPTRPAQQPANAAQAAPEKEAEPARDVVRPPDPAQRPSLDPGWMLPVVPLRAEVTKWLDDFLTSSSRWAEQRKEILLPPGFPILSGQRTIYRTYDGIYVADLKAKEKQLEWWNHTDGGAMLLCDPNKKVMVDAWKTMYEQHGPRNILFDNSLTGSASADAVRAYAVDDLFLPPHANFLQQFGRFGGNGQPVFGPLGDETFGNRLRAYHLESGKLVWELGGRLARTADENKYKATYFLGPPLPLDGKVYVLNEKDGEIRLLCLKPEDTIDVPRPPTTEWARVLTTPEKKLPFDTDRRPHAVQLAQGDGILVCPTNAGVIAGVDLASGKKLWTHSYRGGKPPGRSAWQVSPPVIQEGKVVFTAPDEPDIHCLNLRDGKLLWKAEPADDLYLAGVLGDRVLLVGKTGCRAIALADGKQLWRVETGTPAGRGTMLGKTFYILPLRASADTKEPGLAVVYLPKGAVFAQARWREKVPGNLLLSESMLLSQSANRFTGFPLSALHDFQVQATFPEQPLRSNELDDLWNALGEREGQRPLTALWTLAAFPRQTLPILRKLVQPVRVDEQRIARLVANLRDDDFTVRRQAVEELEKLGELAEPALRAVLEAKPELEMRQRVTELLEKVAKLREAPAPATLRAVRTAKLLGLLDTAENRQCLQELAKGAAGASQTREAKAALERLAKQAPGP